MKTRVLRGTLCVALALGASLTMVAVSGGVAVASAKDPQGTMYVADEGDNAIDVYAPGSTGDVAPERHIEGVNTGINVPGDVKVDAGGDVWVSNYGGASITEYAPGASGDASPICTISGPKTQLNENDDMSLEANGTLVVGDIEDPGGQGGAVLVFAPGSCGDVAPIEEIVGSNTGFDYVDGVGTDAAGTIFADSSLKGSVQVFPAGANGNVAPEYTISGSKTGLGYPDDIIVGFDGELYVTNGYGGPVNSITVFAPGAKGNATPVQDIVGSNTEFGLPDDLAVDTSGNMYVTDSEASVGPAVLKYASGATGNVAPTGALTGPTTTLTVPEGVAVAGPPEGTGATVSTTDSGRSISLGSSTSDTATITEGTNRHSPTGSLVFKLFGPDDGNCSHAPAFVSSSQHVSGAGKYSSKAFTPTAVGTYSWQALYSGDTHNPPVTTACSGIPAETVTVQKKTTTGCSTPVVDHVFRLGNAKLETVRVLITGNCLSGATGVTFGAVAAGPGSFEVVTNRQILASPPEQPAGTVDVTVTTPEGTSAINAPADQYTYYLPRILQLIPNHGPVAGGNTVIIHGLAFSGSPAPTVSFGGKPSPSVVVSGDDTIRARVPAGTAGTVNVHVRTFAGTSLSTPASRYTYK